MAPDDDRGAGFDDLFDDLDSFFNDAPMEPPSAPPPPARPRDDTVPLPPEEPPEAPPSDPTAEMPAEDWGRLRDVLREEEDGRELELPGGVAEFDDEVEEPGQGLLGVRGAPVAAARTEDGPSEPAPPDPSGGSEPPGGVSGQPEAGTPPAEERFFSELPWDEEAMDEVGAAADHLSEEFGDATVEGSDAILVEPVESADGGPERPPPVPDERTPPPIQDDRRDWASHREPMPSAPPSPHTDVPADRPGPRTIRVTDPEDISQPSFRPPARRGFTSALQGTSGGGRNLPAAVLSAVILAAVGLTLLAWKPGVFALVVVGPIVLTAQAELYRAMQRRGYQPATALGLVMGGLALAGAYWRGEQAMLLFAALTVVLSFLWFLVVPPRLREQALTNMGVTVLGVAYVPLLAGFILVILSQANQGRAIMLAVLGLTFLYDVSAFIFGSNWGSRPLAPSISPMKTWEGLLGGTVVTAIASMLILPPAIGAFDLKRSLGLFVVVAVFAPLGDLAESSIKRDLGIKDMGTLLPGHGGALDRIDSVLFVAPMAFYFLRLFF